MLWAFSARCFVERPKMRSASYDLVRPQFLCCCPTKPKPTMHTSRGKHTHDKQSWCALSIYRKCACNTHMPRMVDCPKCAKRKLKRLPEESVGEYEARRMACSLCEDWPKAIDEETKEHRGQLGTIWGYVYPQDDGEDACCGCFKCLCVENNNTLKDYGVNKGDSFWEHPHCKRNPEKDMDAIVAPNCCGCNWRASQADNTKIDDEERIAHEAPGVELVKQRITIGVKESSQ